MRFPPTSAVRYVGFDMVLTSELINKAALVMKMFGVAGNPKGCGGPNKAKKFFFCVFFCRLYSAAGEAILAASLALDSLLPPPCALLIYLGLQKAF